MNRRARHEYFINDVVEAGIILTGTEVKALREGKANIAESYASPEEGAIWLVNANIPEYSAGNRENHSHELIAAVFSKIFSPLSVRLNRFRRRAFID